MPARLSKADILRGYGSFARVFSGGKPLTVGGIRCFYTRNKSLPSSLKVGFAVSRNVRNAAVRNRIKRLMREAWRRQGERLQRNTNELQVVFLYTGSGERKNLRLQAVEEAMQKAVEKLNNTIHGTGA